MTVKAFQARILDRLRRALARKRVSLASLSSASKEALALCGRYRASLPDRVVFAYERRHEDLWKTR